MHLALSQLRRRQFHDDRAVQKQHLATEPSASPLLEEEEEGSILNLGFLIGTVAYVMYFNRHEAPPANSED